MRVAFAAAIFDVLHDGHVELLRLMRANADRVVVILHDDRSCWLLKGKVPMQSLHQRVHSVKVTGLADRVLVTYSTDPAGLFARVARRYRRHDLSYWRGDDLTAGFPGHWYLVEHGIPVRFKAYTEGVSSSAIRDGL